MNRPTDFAFSAQSTAWHRADQPVTGGALPLTTSLNHAAARSVLFIDSGVEDYKTLVQSAAAGTEIYRLRDGVDATQQITNTLLGRSGIESVQIVSHGRGGGLKLGESWLNAANLSTYANQLRSWGEALTDSADILLYGCNVGAGAAGQGFVNLLAQATGADVAASEDLTGNAALGGDWVLEVTSENGQIESRSLMAADFGSVLQTFTVTNTANDGAGSLRQAIQDANDTAGDDVIQFDGATFADGSVDTLNLSAALPRIDSNVSLRGGSDTLALTGITDSTLFFVESGTVSFQDFVLDGGGTNGNRLIFVDGGNVNLTDMTLQNGFAQGGAGSGGGLGAGGALFINEGATVNIANTSFLNNQAIGGAGGTAGGAGGGLAGLRGFKGTGS
ncbi:DUF4347 domain-containing protein, partial [filamentous cyanobacterium LEGE 11480]